MVDGACKISSINQSIDLGGMYSLLAEQQVTAVTNCPLSADVSPPTWLLPLVAMIHNIELGTTVTPVSSQL